MLWDYVMGTFRAHPQDPGSIEERRAEAKMALEAKMAAATAAEGAAVAGKAKCG